jgi:hypothetical protein
VHNVSNVRQVETYTAEPIVPGPSTLKDETAIAKFKRYSSPGSDRIPTQLIEEKRRNIIV